MALTFAASAGTAYLYRRQYTSDNDDDVINTSTFSPFTVTGREQVSPTAFILTLRPSAWVDPEGFESEWAQEGDKAARFSSTRIRDAWRHGLWSVEIKQPQLQIARHYTPLPTFPSLPSLPPVEEKTTSESSNTNKVQAIGSGEARRNQREQDGQADLRILIRRMDGGEMSNYLSRQRVGDIVWLRGPHLGFDVLRRLGNGDSNDGDTETRRVGSQMGVVFLAGGTGIAPALQIAHKLLDSHDSDGGQPRISILWANRWGADALGRKQSPSPQRKPNAWFRFWDRDGGNSSADLQQRQKEPDKKPASSLALQIQDLKRRHPSRFEISYFIDDEESFIKAYNVEDALASTGLSSLSGPRGPSLFSSSVNNSCAWHSAKAVEFLPDDNDAARSTSSDPTYACTCTSKEAMDTPITRPGLNLICVSGPDGFIEAYAGAKRWHDGNEMQGAVGGLLGRLQRDKKMKASEWLVLKL